MSRERHPRSQFARRSTGRPGRPGARAAPSRRGSPSRRRHLRAGTRQRARPPRSSGRSQAASAAHGAPISSRSATPAAHPRRDRRLPARQRLAAAGARGYRPLSGGAALADARLALAVQTGPAQSPTTAPGLSRALAGVAETGTLVLASGADNPVTLAFVPDTHLVVVAAPRRSSAATRMRWRCWQPELGPAVLPRTLNFISGPSRTGDIGGQIVHGRAWAAASRRHPGRERR